MSRVNAVKCGVATAVVAVFLAALPAPAGAQQVLLGSLGGAHAGADDGGALVRIDQTTGAATVIGTPVPGYGLPGLAVNSAGQVYAVTSDTDGAGAYPRLITVDPTNGALLSTVGNLTYLGNPGVALADLAFQPGTGVLFGVARGDQGLSFNDIVTVNTSTAEVTLIGSPNTNGDGGYLAIAFAPDGTFYAKETNAGGFWTLDPTNAQVLTSMTLNPAEGGLGLAVRPSDGVLFMSECCNTTLGNDIYTVDGATGAATLLGSAGGTRRVQDLDFYTPAAAIPAATHSGLAALALLIAALAVWVLVTRRTA